MSIRHGYRFGKLLFLLLSLSACMQSTPVMSRGDAPEWINGEPDLYPNFKYLSATGSASNVETAKSRALANLSKIFEVRIREVSTARQNVSSHRENDEETVAVDLSRSSTVNTHTDKMIEGARIAEQWQSPDDLTWYALAVLDRGQAGNNLRQEMNRIDEETAFLLEQADKRQDPLQRIADLSQALQKQYDRQLLQKTLKVIDTRGKGAPASWNLTELKERRDQALRRLPIATGVDEDSIGGLDRILQAAASEAGLKPGQGGYRLSAALHTQDVLRRQGWYWLRGTLKLTLSDASGTALGYKSWPLKVSAQDEGQLASRMRKQVEKKLDTELLDTLLSFTGK